MEKVENKEKLVSLLKSNPNVVVDFYADWCGPCRMLEPIFESVSKKLTDIKFVKLNVDNLQEISSEYKVASIPTVIVFNNGKEIKRNSGFMSENDLLEFIK